MPGVDGFDIDISRPRFHLDEDVLPGSCPAVRVPFINHGKQITRNRAGLWFCAFTFDRAFLDRNWLALSVSATPDAEGSEFAPPILLVGKTAGEFEAVFQYEGRSVGSSCLLTDSEDRLHVVFEQEGGLFLITADVSGDAPRARLTQRSEWSPPQPVAPAGCTLGDATFLPAGELAVYHVNEGRLYETLLSGETTLLCENAAHPVVHVAGDGTRHVAFERDRRIFYLRSDGGRDWVDSRGNPGPELVARFCSSWPSIATTTTGKIVIAYQGEGKVDLKREPALYQRNRPAGGSTVSYAVLSDSEWRIHDFLRSSEILLKRTPSSSIPLRDAAFVPFMEEFWRPSLTVDKHGVVWMFYLNTTRRHTYFTRFQGETFGDHHEARGPYDCLSRILFVQKESRNQPAIGTLTFACHQAYFDCITVPEYRSAQHRRVVFLDNLEVDEMVGVECETGVWQKHPTPVFGAGISGTSEDDHVAWCDVRKTDDGFYMKYIGMGDLYRNSMPGRAFGRDGVHWEKREPFDDSLLTLDGKAFPSSFWRPIFLEDPDATDPTRRYKGLVGSYIYVHRMREIRRWIVIASPDGLAWHTVPGLPTVLQGDISVNFHLIRDDEDRDPRRRYKVLMLMGSASGRAGTVYTSPDLIHWERAYALRENPELLSSSIGPWLTGPIALDPDGGESPWEEEVHDAVLWRENGLLMYHYDAFYFAANQHTQKALGVSRDGKHYYRIKRGAVNMPHGNCGEWDSGRDRTSVPLRVGDELWMYFAGMPAGCFYDPDADDPAALNPAPPSPDDNRLHREQRPWRVGLAKLRVDGWGYVQLKRGAPSGYLTTIPFEYQGGDLVVNGCGLGVGGIRVEVIHTDGQSVVEGFGKQPCAFDATDGVECRASWGNNTPLAPGMYRLRVVFEGLQARLYSFGFDRRPP